jgi:hypothetical protein
MGLCSSHYQQRVRGRPLVPLRQRPVEALVTLGLRVPQLVREAASADPAGARAALLAWATQLAESRRKATPTPSPLPRPRGPRPAKRSKARPPACARCGMPATALIHGEGPDAVNTHPFSPGQNGRQR